MRVFLAGVLAIALLFAGSVAVIVYGAPAVAPPLGARPGAPPPPAPAAERAPLAPLTGPAGPAPIAEPPVPPAALLAIPLPPPEAPPAVQRAAVELQTHHSRVAFRQELVAAIATLHAEVAACDGRERLAGASLILSLEGGAGSVRIADASAGKAGAASAADVRCAIGAVRGKVLPVPSAIPGSRWQMPFALRSPAAATARRR